MTAVVIGNLAVDVRGSLPSADEISNFHAGHDVAITVDSINMVTGGSAWLFAQALGFREAESPLILGCIGDDVGGEFILRQLQTNNLSLVGIERTEAAATSTVVINYLPDGTRLLIKSRTQANAYLSAPFVRNVLSSEDPSVDVVWISGYALVDTRATRIEAVKDVCKWARDRGAKIFVDLVPHAFHSSVGDLNDVFQLVGRVDGIVAELETYCGLGYCSTEAMASDPLDACKSVARQVSSIVTYAIVQHRASSSEYLQVIGAAGVDTHTDTYAIDSNNLRGLGDLMSVDALGFLKLLPMHH